MRLDHHSCLNLATLSREREGSLSARNKSLDCEIAPRGQGFSLSLGRERAQLDVGGLVRYGLLLPALRSNRRTLASKRFPLPGALRQRRKGRRIPTGVGRNVRSPF